MKEHKTLRKVSIVLGAFAGIIALFVIQRDFIYGTKGNLGQGTHPRF